MKYLRLIGIVICAAGEQIAFCSPRSDKQRRNLMKAALLIDANHDRSTRGWSAYELINRSEIIRLCDSHEEATARAEAFIARCRRLGYIRPAHTRDAIIRFDGENYWRLTEFGFERFAFSVGIPWTTSYKLPY